MTTSHEPSYSNPQQPVPSYFLEEATELLQKIDDDLKQLGQDFSVRKVHTLMRTAHTLKGAAASVGLDAIKVATHSLEDIFRRLCMPNASLTPTVEKLIFEAYDCLKFLLSAQLANSRINEADILARMAGVITQLQAHLGDQLVPDGYLPTSTDLGYDPVQIIFEERVTQQLITLENALDNNDPEILTELLESQATIFFGLAESFEVPGFGEIAQVTRKALRLNPNQVAHIAKVALKDYRTSQANILMGERSPGGQPSITLRKLSGEDISPSDSQIQTMKSKGYLQQRIFSFSWLCFPWQLSPTYKTDKSQSSNPRKQVSPIINCQISAADPIVPDVVPVRDPLRTSSNVQATSLATSCPSVHPPNVSDTAPAESETLRMNINHIQELNHIIGELLTQQNHQTLYQSQLTGSSKSLLSHIDQQKQRLHDLQQQINQQSFNLLASSPNVLDQEFDPLELDHYNHSQRLVQSLMDIMAQQLENAEAIESWARQNEQNLEKQQRLIVNLRETMLDARMQPLDTVLRRFNHVTNRLTEQTGKPVILKIKGENILVDKVIADKLYDPLLHLVRNAFDHGIETPEIRQQQGKKRDAKIRLYASQKNHHLIVHVCDNGRGLNLDVIRQKAIEKQFITQEEARLLSPTQISSLIFKPGFSTVNHLNEISGRGIGLDAVQAQITALKGKITVTHWPGQGTCFTLKIPSELSITKLLLCQAGDQVCALIPDAIEQIVTPESEQIRLHKKGKILIYRRKGKKALIPIFSLLESLNYPLPHSQVSQDGDDPGHPIILLRHKHKLIGLEVDQLLGEQDLVIRPLGEMAVTPSYLYGCSVLPDGNLGLVIDGVSLALRALARISKTEKHVSNDVSNNVPNLAKPTIKVIETIKNTSSLSRSASGQHILIIDDSVTVRNTLAQILHEAGYNVIKAKEGVEAIQKLQHNSIAAILCDIEMPGMNGFEFLKVRRQSSGMASTPTIMLTSRNSQKHRQLAKELGATDYLTKPYSPSQLLEALANALQVSSTVS